MSARKGVRVALDRAAERRRVVAPGGCMTGLLVCVLIEAVVVLAVVLLTRVW